jgi:hypothetical protein
MVWRKQEQAERSLRGSAKNATPQNCIDNLSLHLRNLLAFQSNRARQAWRVAGLSPIGEEADMRDGHLKELLSQEPNPARIILAALWRSS